MTPHVLNGAFERVTRAEKHLGDLRREIAKWLLEQEDAVVFQFNPNPPHNEVVDTSNCVGPPFTIGILIGETCYNLRTALEYLMFEIARFDSGEPQDFTQFPVVDSKDKFRSWKKDARRKGVNISHITIIERLQPYNGVKWTESLNEIFNRDKHREFTGIKGQWHLLVSHSLNEPNKTAFANIPRPVRRTYHPLLRREVDVKFALTATITLNDGTPVTDALEEIKTQVANTLEAFKSDF